jgi:hypothetical protein
MHTGVRDIFNQECAHIVFDRALLKKMCEIEAGFVNKKQEHIEFFGGNTTGVQVVRFTDQDRDRIFIDLLEVDEKTLEDRIHDLPDINPEYKVSSNIFNIACVWIMYGFENSKHLDKDQKEEGKIRVALYLNYKVLTSILFRFFKYPANPETAQATYAQLSYRFLLKAKGSWAATLRSRSEDTVRSTSIWYHVIQKLDDDYEVVKMLNDVQGRIKDIIKNIYSVFIKVHEQGSKIAMSSSQVETDGELILKDHTRGKGLYLRYIKTIIPDKNSFYKAELFEVICSVVPTSPEHMLKNSLTWISGNYGHMKDNWVEETIEDIMEHALQYLSENKSLLKHKEDIGSILLKLRGTYTSSRANDEKLLLIKQRIEKLVKLATNSKNDSVVAAVRTAFCLYVILRSFTMTYYQNK